MQDKMSASTSRRHSTATTPQKQHQNPYRNQQLCLPQVMNTASNINTNTKRSKANATRGKRAAASKTASGCSAAATAAAAAALMR